MRARLLVAAALLLIWARPAAAYTPWDEWRASREARAGRWAEATAMYEKLIQLHPDSARDYLNLGQCYYRQGDFEKAEANFKKARDLDNGIPGGPSGSVKGQSFYDLGNTLFRKNKLEDALEAYKGALRWDEMDDDARYNVQVILDKLKKKKPPPKKKDDKKKDKDKDKNKDKKDKKKDNKKNKDKNKKKPDKGKNDKKKQPPGKGKQPPPDKNKGNQGKNPPPPPGQQPPQDPSKMSKQDAERLLKYFQNREKSNLNKQMKKGRPARPVGGDDW